MKYRKCLLVFVLAVVSLALVMSGCNPEPEVDKKLTGTVSIPEQVVLGGTVTANTDGAKGGSGAFSYAWEHGIISSDDIVNWVPIPEEDDLFSDGGKTIDLDKSYFDEGDFVRVKVTRAGREGTLTSNGGEIFEVTITGVDISIAGATDDTVSPDTNYQLTAIVSFDSDADLSTDLFQDVIWSIAELSFHDGVNNTAVDLTPFYIADGVLRFNDSKWAVSKLTIKAKSAADPTIESDPIELDVNWGNFLQINLNLLASWVPRGTLGFTALDGRGGEKVYTYYIDKGKGPDEGNGAQWDEVFAFLSGWSADLSPYAKMAIDLAFDENMKDIIQIHSHLYDDGTPDYIAWVQWWWAGDGGPNMNVLRENYPGLPDFVTVDTVYDTGQNATFALAKATAAAASKNFGGVFLRFPYWNTDNGGNSAANDKVYFRNLRLYK